MFDSVTRWNGMPSPFRSVGRSVCERGRVDDVVDEDVVPRLVAVPVDRGRLPREHLGGEDRDDARLPERILPRPVDVPQRERSEVEASRLLIEREVVDADLLRDAIR